MPTVKFETGQSVNFASTPTQADIEEVASKLNIQKIPDTQNQPTRNINTDPYFKAQMGGAETILPNLASMVGNVPSDVGNIIGTAVDSTAGKIGKSISTASDIYKDRGFVQGTKDIYGGYADTMKNIADFPAKAGTWLGEKNNQMDLTNKLSPIQEQALKQRDEIIQKLADAYKAGKDTSHLVMALKYNQENLDSLNTQIGTQDSRQQGAQQISDIIKYPIEHPVQTAITAETLAPETQAAISSKIKPITSTIESIPIKAKQAIVARQPQAINELEQTYSDLMSGTTLGKKKIAKIETKSETLNNAGTEGKTPMRTLAEEGIIPNQAGTKLDTFNQAEHYKKRIAPLRDANRQALKETGLSSAPVKLDDLETKAIEYARTPENINAGRFDKMQKDIQDEFSLLRTHYPTGEIPLNVVDDIKSARWDNVFKNKGLVEADVLKKNSEYAIAKSLQKTIEETAIKAGNSEVAQLNRAIGDKLEASKFLQDLNGKTVKGGRLLKYVTTGIGASFGHTIPGKIIGAMGGNLVGDLIISNTVASPVKRFILRALEVKDPEAYTKTLQWLERQNLDRETRLLLSSPKDTNPILNQGRPIPALNRKNNKIDYTGKETII